MKKKTSLLGAFFSRTLKRQRNYVTIVSMFMLLSNSVFGQVFNDADDFADAAKEALAGDVIVLKDGIYNDVEVRFAEIKGTEENPITIKAETVGGVTLKGGSLFSFKKCEYIILEGFVIDGEGDNTLVKLEGSNNIRITRNVFELKTVEPIKWVFIGGIFDDFTFQFTSHHNRIDHNVFKNKMTPGHYITVDGTNDGNNDYRQSQYDRIDHNHFINNSPRAVNEQESIRVGWSRMSLSSGFTTVEFNLFEDCDGDPEIVSVKSSDNIVRHNTFLKSYGVLSLRHGNRNRIEGNYFFGGGKPLSTSPAGSRLSTGGIRIYGEGHVIINNYMEGLNGTGFDAPIAITQGDASNGGSSDLTKHFIAENVVLAYNTLVNNVHGIEIGFDNNGKYNKVVKGVSFINNLVTGSQNSLVEYVDGRTQSGGITWKNNLMFSTGSASLLSGNPTAFTEAEVMQSDTKLVLENSVWNASADTPILANGLSGSLIVDTDIQGQTRPLTSNPGADHFSLETVRFGPLTATDVGPLAPEGDLSPPTNNIIVSQVTEFTANSGSQTVNVTANVDWMVTETSDWITLSATSGSNNGSFNVDVSENETIESRLATVTVTDGALVRTINVKQAGITAPVGSTKLAVIAVTASAEQAPNNIKENTIDGNLKTRWSAEGIGQTITFDLGDVFNIDLLKIAVLNGATRSTFFDIVVSTDGENFVPVLTGKMNTATNELENYPIKEAQGRYVRIIGGGNSETLWNSITEVEIYGSSALVLSVSENILNLQSGIEVYPNPVVDNVFITLKNTLYSDVTIFDINGKQVLSKKIANSNMVHSISVESLADGIYFLQLSNNETSFIEKILIAK